MCKQKAQRYVNNIAKNAYTLWYGVSFVHCLYILRTVSVFTVDSYVTFRFFLLFIQRVPDSALCYCAVLFILLCARYIVAVLFTWVALHSFMFTQNLFYFLLSSRTGQVNKNCSWGMSIVFSALLEVVSGHYCAFKYLRPAPNSKVFIKYNGTFQINSSSN